jgi:hypothetical protein
MGRALQLPGSNSVLKANPKLTFRRGAYTYAVDTLSDKSTYSVSDGKNTITLPIRWGFGAGSQTWVLERDGRLYESLVSFYPAISGLDITTGDEALSPKSLDEAVGRGLTRHDSHDCFGCHATYTESNGKLALESLQPGVTCERCHLGSNKHALDSVLGNYDSAPPNLHALSSEDVSSFCGQCHRTWEMVVRNRSFGEVNVRFQPYRLANSKCFDGTDPRISCLACHDPHQDLVRQVSFYDAKCQACHASAARLAITGAKVCPVAKTDCVSCHMPKVKMPNGHMTFTDHQIRIVKPGESYPN